MKNTLPYIFFFILATTPGFSQIARKVDHMLNVGLGVQSYALGGLCNGASFELGFTDQVSAGGFFDYALTGTKVGDRRWKAQFFNVGVRGSYHLARLLGIGDDKFDPYAGLSVGTRSSLHRDQVDQTGQLLPRPKGIFPGVHLGGFYRFSQKIGGFAEMGLGVAALRLGVTGKF
ncbi:hypothetical protein ACO2Q8_06595 [Larkinella sp. VNQ87]|uniref:hypothetical protein n=1 Tax=Larkinella sp. VNQ87 TaxID=3400921 RepID=UPI003C0808D5